MQIFSPEFLAGLQVRDTGKIAPVWFVYFVARDRDTGDDVPIGFWSGAETITINLRDGEGNLHSRIYLGGCGLSIGSLEYVADLTDNPVNLSISQIAPDAQMAIRGYDMRLAYCEIHATTRRGGALSSEPQLVYVGVVDTGPIATPQAGGEGAVSLSIRSELMHQLTAINPAKSSDRHQTRRHAGDRFSEYSGTVGAREIQWYRG